MRAGYCAVLCVLVAVVSGVFVSWVGSGLAMSCSSTEAALSKHVNVSFAGATYYAGYLQQSASNQDDEVVVVTAADTERELEALG
jgi:hypothetical protein